MPEKAPELAIMGKKQVERDWATAIEIYVFFPPGYYLKTSDSASGDCGHYFHGLPRICVSAILPGFDGGLCPVTSLPEACPLLSLPSAPVWIVAAAFPGTLPASVTTPALVFYPRCPAGSF